MTSESGYAMTYPESHYIKEPVPIKGPVVGLCVYPLDSVSRDASLNDGYKAFALTPVQTHSLNVAVVKTGEENLDDTDALLTFRDDFPIGVKTADCVPILVYAPDINCIGAIHAGWKGTIGGIVDNVLDTIESYGGKVETLTVAFGPSISKETYEVDEDLAQRFAEAGFADYVSRPTSPANKPHIDLQGVNMERFLRRGVPRQNITLHKGCTLASKDSDGTLRYPSHRRSAGSPVRLLTYIVLTK